MILSQQKFTGKPEWIFQNKFFEDTSSPIFYHGFSSYDWAHGFVSDEKKYHLGEGFYGKGFYLTTNPELAYQHTFVQEYGERDKELVLPFKICSTNGTKFSTLSSLCKMGQQGLELKDQNEYGVEKEIAQLFNQLVNFAESIKDPVLKSKFKEIIFGENGETVTTLAAYLGYDYVYNDGRVGGEINDKQVIVLNRGCMEVDAYHALRAVTNKQLLDIHKDVNRRLGKE